MPAWRKLTICAVNFCFEAGDERLAYFYDYFVKEYREGMGNGLLHAPAAMFQSVRQEDVQNCRKALKTAFAGYRCGRGDVKALEKLLGEYREYITCCHDGHAKDRYNAFVYRYMAEAHVGMKAAAAKLGVVKETVFNYIDRDIDEMLVMCMGVPAASQAGEQGGCRPHAYGGSRIFHSMARRVCLMRFSQEVMKRQLWNRAGGSRGMLWGRWIRRSGHTAVTAGTDIPALIPT